MHLLRALRVVAARRGEGRSSFVEAPFVGRDAELRLVKELLHTTTDEGKAHVVSVIGDAGIGKSRLAWEFYKYFDGLVEELWWHRGRCLAYGEGVAYWALAEMVRMRAGIAEDEPHEAQRAKLSACVAERIPDADERAWIEPRLAHLLGLTERTAPDQEDLFSAWRRFFERMAEEGPAILLFEDLHWADAALLDFIEYLAEWSRNHPLFIVTLARPELLDRRPTWGAGRRNFHSIVLEPLPEAAREELLRGLVPGLPDELRTRIAERAEGSAALRHRDRADAARPRRARPGGGRVPRHGTGRGPRRPGDPARPDRRASRWARPPPSGTFSRTRPCSVAPSARRA